MFRPAEQLYQQDPSGGVAGDFPGCAAQWLTSLPTPRASQDAAQQRPQADPGARGPGPSRAAVPSCARSSCAQCMPAGQPGDSVLMKTRPRLSSAHRASWQAA